MKKIILLIALSITALSLKAKEIQIEKIITVDSVGKDELYTRALNWVSETYGNSESVIDLKDKETGIIVVKGWSNYTSDGSKFWNSQFEGKIWHRLSIYVKDGRYKIVCTFRHEGGMNPRTGMSYSFGALTDDVAPPQTFGNKKGATYCWDECKRESSRDFLLIDKSLNNKMTQPLTVDSDW